MGWVYYVSLLNYVCLQHACVVLWNLSMPLLQHNLCHHVVKPFTTSVKALGEIDRYIRTSCRIDRKCAVFIENREIL